MGSYELHLNGTLFAECATLAEAKARILGVDHYGNRWRIIRSGLPAEVSNPVPIEWAHLGGGNWKAIRFWSPPRVLATTL